MDLLFNNSLIEHQAKVFAYAAHSAVGAVRKYTGEHYIVHCREVAELVRSAHGTQEMLAAAWLHDVVEDTKVTFEQIELVFGEDIRHLVYCLTDVSRPEDGNRAMRKERDRRHMAAAPYQAKTIKLADMISNSYSIIERDPDFAKIYMKEKRELLKVLKEGHASLYRMAEGIVEGYFQSNTHAVFSTKEE